MLFETILAIGMIVSAVLAIYLKETIASVLSLSTLMLLLSLLYFNLNAPLAAIFQLALGAGTAAIFLLAGDTLTTKRYETTSRKTMFLAVIASAVLCVPMLVGTIETGSVIESMEISLSQTYGI
jgi:NADH:ubiquinone oxidoreductase subunit 6 (subunit J)